MTPEERAVHLGLIFGLPDEVNAEKLIEDAITAAVLTFRARCVGTLEENSVSYQKDAEKFGEAGETEPAELFQKIANVLHHAAAAIERLKP